MSRALVFGLCLCLGPVSRAHPSELLAKVEFVEQHERIAPSRGFSHTTVEISAAIKSTGQVSVAENRASGRAASSGNRSSTLGRPGTRQLWKVISEKRLANYTAYTNFTRVIYLTIDGPRCSIEVQYPLQPGETEYRYRRLSNGERAVARSISISHPRCELRTM